MKIICVGRNYLAHAKELNNDLPTEPVIFTKLPTALIKDGQPMYYPSFTANLHYEGELVVRINKNGKNIQTQFAHKYVDEITFGIDFTARDLQDKLKKQGLPWEISKAFDGSAVIGSFISLAGMDLANIEFSTVLNGKTVQQGNSSLMIFSIPTIISYVSKFFTLQQGDLIYTGTPAGVGAVAIGDVLEGYIGGQKLMECTLK